MPQEVQPAFSCGPLFVFMAFIFTSHIPNPHSQSKKPDLRLVLSSQEGVAIESMTNEWMVKHNIASSAIAASKSETHANFAEAANY